ncbi:MAG: c-type cytochrome [Planctomycetaceae bacterium]
MKPCLYLLTIVSLAGCSRLEPEFQPRASYDELVPDAKAAVDATMLHYFGTPTQMKFWENLPVHHSGAVGSVVETVTTPRGAVTGVKVEWQAETWPVKAGQTVGWLTEDLPTGAGSELPVVSAYDPETKVITFKKPLETAPEAGARMAVNAGEVLHQGRLLYAEHCQHCHGVSGDGNGPTARYLNPLPRDYRDAKFKFTSTPYTHPPARDDLARIVENGIPGTYMPSFKLLEPEELVSIVEYVRWLSMRGQCETLLIGEVTGKDSVASDAKETLLSFLPDEAEAVVIGPWVEADTAEMAILPESERPEATPESIAIGQKLFISATAKCSDCHGKSGLGNGTQTLAVEQGQTEPGLHDVWGHIVVPRNLRSGIYRGGRRPLDIYRRIAAGIKGTPMNGFKTNLYNLKSEELGLKGDEKDLAVWHVVNYVLNMPYEELTPGSGLAPTMAMEVEPARTETGAE